jgi:hypothetical protein
MTKMMMKMINNSQVEKTIESLAELIKIPSL